MAGTPDPAELRAGRISSRDPPRRDQKGGLCSHPGSCILHPCAERKGYHWELASSWGWTPGRRPRVACARTSAPGFFAVTLVSQAGWHLAVGELPLLLGRSTQTHSPSDCSAGVSWPARSHAWTFPSSPRCGVPHSDHCCDASTGAWGSRSCLHSALRCHSRLTAALLGCVPRAW